jgi:hypothetical protein
MLKYLKWDSWSMTLFPLSSPDAYTQESKRAENLAIELPGRPPPSASSVPPCFKGVSSAANWLALAPLSLYLGIDSQFRRFLALLAILAIQYRPLSGTQCVVEGL